MGENSGYPGAQTAMLDGIKETKEFDAIRSEKTGPKLKQNTLGKPKDRPNQADMKILWFQALQIVSSL